MNIIASHNLILPKYLIIVKEKGSKNSKARARVSRASVIPLLSSLLFSVPPSRRKVLGAKPEQAGKKEGVEGKEFLPACFRSRSV